MHPYALTILKLNILRVMPFPEANVSVTWVEVFFDDIALNACALK